MRCIGPVTFALILAACGPREPASVDGPEPDAQVRSCAVEIVTAAPPGSSTVQVAGTFSDWQPLDMQADGERLSLGLGELVPGTYAYKFVVDGVFEGDPPVDVRSTWDDGYENRALVVRDCRRPSIRAESVEVVGDRVVGRFVWQRAATGAPLERDSVVATVGDQDLPADAVEVSADGTLTVTAPAPVDGKYTLALTAADVDGHLNEEGRVLLPAWREAERFEWGDGVMYFPFIDRFRKTAASPEPPITGASPGAGYLEGDLVGLLHAIEEGLLEDLGVRSLWLTPVVDNPDGAWIGSDASEWYTGYHGYWPVAPRTVEGRLGTADIPAEQALKLVIDEAHARGVRVLFDVVLNHVHEQHPWIQEHPEWFDLADPCTCGSPGCGWEDTARTCRFAPYLPDVEYRQQGAVDAMVDELFWWVDTFDVDGFRVDAAKHMDHVILRTLRAEVDDRLHKPGAPHFYLVGETFTGAGAQGLIAAYIGPHELDGQFDFPLYWRIREAVRDDGSFHALAAEARASNAAYGAQLPYMSTFFGNHDVARLATELAGCEDWGAMWGVCHDHLADGVPTETDALLIERLTFAWAIVATQPGPPLLYYGDELGLAGGNDPDNRRMRPWPPYTTAQQTLFDAFAELGQLRARTPALQRGDRRELWVDSDVYAYARQTEAGDLAIVALSRWRQGAFSLPVPPNVTPEGTRFVDHEGTPVGAVAGGRLELTLGRWSWQVLVPE